MSAPADSSGSPAAVPPPLGDAAPSQPEAGEPSAAVAIDVANAAEAESPSHDDLASPSLGAAAPPRARASSRSSRLQRRRRRTPSPSTPPTPHWHGSDAEAASPNSDVERADDELEEPKRSAESDEDDATPHFVFVPPSPSAAVAPLSSAAEAELISHALQPAPDPDPSAFALSSAASSDCDGGGVGRSGGVDSEAQVDCLSDEGGSGSPRADGQWQVAITDRAQREEQEMRDVEAFGLPPAAVAELPVPAESPQVESPEAHPSIEMSPLPALVLEPAALSPAAAGSVASAAVAAPVLPTKPASARPRAVLVPLLPHERATSFPTATSAGLGAAAPAGSSRRSSRIGSPKHTGLPSPLLPPTLMRAGSVDVTGGTGRIPDFGGKGGAEASPSYFASMDAGSAMAGAAARHAISFTKRGSIIRVPAAYTNGSGNHAARRVQQLQHVAEKSTGQQQQQQQLLLSSQHAPSPHPSHRGIGEAALLERRPSLDLSNLVQEDDATTESWRRSCCGRLFSRLPCMARAGLPPLSRLPVIDPSVPWLWWWRLCVLLSVVYNGLIIPYRLAFGMSDWASRPALISTLTLDAITDLALLIDIGITAHTGFVAEGGEVVMSRRAIRARYLRGWLALDVVTSIPFDLMRLLGVQALQYFQLPVLLRVLKLHELTYVVERSRIMQLLQPLFALLYLTHVSACLYFGISRWEGFGSNQWVATAAGSEDGDYGTPLQYFTSFFWAFAALTDRDFYSGTPVTPLESCYTLLLMLAGVVGLAFVVGNVTAMIEARQARAKAFQRDVSGVDRLMQRYRVSNELQEQVAGCHSYLWTQRRDMNLPAVLEQLPDTLRTAVSSHLLAGMLQRVSLFADASSGLISALINRMQPTVCLPGDVLVSQGDIGDSARTMYFVASGEIQLWRMDPTFHAAPASAAASSSGEEEVSGMKLLRTLHAGDSFGEYGLILATERACSARAATCCTVYALSRAPFEEVMRVFSKSAVIIRNRAMAHHAMVMAQHHKNNMLKQQMSRKAAPSSSSPQDSQARAAVAATASPPQPSGATAVQDERPVRVLLRARHNAKQYRSAKVVLAFRVTPSTTLALEHPSDWLLLSDAGGGVKTPSVISDALFHDTYEPEISSTAAAGVAGNKEATATFFGIKKTGLVSSSSASQPLLHAYRKKGMVLAARIARDCYIKNGLQREAPRHYGASASSAAAAPAVLHCRAGDFLLQDEFGAHSVMAPAEFQASYVEVHVSSGNSNSRVLAASAASIRAMTNSSSNKQSGGSIWGRRVELPPGTTLPAGIVLPSARWWRVWQVVLVCVSLYNLFGIPLRMAFLEATPDDRRNVNPAWLVFDYVGDAMLWASIALRMYCIAFVTEQGKLITDRAIIKKRYCRQWLLLDALAALPLDVGMVSTGVWSVWRLPRALLLWRLHVSSSRLLLRSSRWSSHLSLCRLLFAFMLLAHWVASVYYTFTISESEDSPSKWLPQPHERETLTLQYFRAQYFSFVVLTGWGTLLEPRGLGELLYSIATTALGVLVVSILFGEMIELVGSMDPLAAEHSKRSKEVAHCLEQLKLPIALQERVNAYMQHQWNVQRGADLNSSLAGLPHTLQLRLKMSVCGSALRHTPFFQAASDATVLAVVEALRTQVFPPGETIFSAGDIGDAMFIINSGAVELLLPVPAAKLAEGGTTPPPQRLKIIGKGSFLGEQSLLRCTTRSATAIAHRSCELLLLHRDALASVLAADPEFAATLRRIMRSRLNQVRAQKKRLHPAHIATSAAAIERAEDHWERMSARTVSAVRGPDSNFTVHGQAPAQLSPLKLSMDAFIPPQAQGREHSAPSTARPAAAAGSAASSATPAVSPPSDGQRGSYSIGSARPAGILMRAASASRFSFASANSTGGGGPILAGLSAAHRAGAGSATRNVQLHTVGDEHEHKLDGAASSSVAAAEAASSAAAAAIPARPPMRHSRSYSHLTTARDHRRMLALLQERQQQQQQRRTEMNRRTSTTRSGGIGGGAPALQDEGDSSSDSSLSSSVSSITRR